MKIGPAGSDLLAARDETVFYLFEIVSIKRNLSDKGTRTSQ